MPKTKKKSAKKLGRPYSEHSLRNSGIVRTVKMPADVDAAIVARLEQGTMSYAELTRELLTAWLRGEITLPSERQRRGEGPGARGE